MEIIPAIDLKGGRCVRLYQGDYARETIFSDDPTATAREWHRLGATRLHVVDLDGAALGSPQNGELIGRIVAAVPIPVQMGGGIRTIESIELALSWGADRVVLGTAAVKDPDLVEAACKTHPDAIIVALDARAGRVAINGWLEDTDQEASALAQRMASLGVPRFLYTDISRDGTGTEPNFAAIAVMQQAAGRPVIASGGVATVEHLKRLEALGVEAVIVGRALYTGGIELPAALEAICR